MYIQGLILHLSSFLIFPCLSSTASKHSPSKRRGFNYTPSVGGSRPRARTVPAELADNQQANRTHGGSMTATLEAGGSLPQGSQGKSQKVMPIILKALQLLSRNARINLISS